MAAKQFKHGSGRIGYPSDVTDEEWAFCAPYLTLMKEDAPQRDHPMRSIFNALRYMVRAGCPWRMIPNDLAPWYTVQQQTQRWIKAGSFEAMAHDLRKVLRLVAEKNSQPSAIILDGRTIQSTPESGHRAGYDGYKRKKGSKVHAAVDTLGNLLALKVTAANEQERLRLPTLRLMFRRLPANTLRWPMWIRDIPERNPQRRRLAGRNHSLCWRNSSRLKYQTNNGQKEQFEL